MKTEEMEVQVAALRSQIAALQERNEALEARLRLRGVTAGHHGLADPLSVSPRTHRSAALSASPVSAETDAAVLETAGTRHAVEFFGTFMITLVAGGAQ